jgi:hypothetical protein
MPVYGITNLLKATGQSMMSFQQLIKGETALANLPQDTKFAIVITGIHKAINESFYETDVAPALMTFQISPEGMVGRFVGYLSFTDSKMRVYVGLDVNAVATNQPVAPDVASTQSGVQLLLEDDITNLSVSIDTGSITISNADQKFKILETYPISHVEGHFESAASGWYGGMKQTLDFLRAHGVETGTVKKQTNIVAVIVIMLAILGTVAIIAASAKH